MRNAVEEPLMGISVERVGETVAVVSVSGVIGERLVRKLREELRGIEKDPPTYVIFDLSATQFLSSTSLGLMVAFANLHQGRFGVGSVVLAGVSEHIRRSMEVLGLLDLFILAPDRAGAIELCGGASGGDSDGV